jgi:hypothetical protein
MDQRAISIIHCGAMKNECPRPKNSLLFVRNHARQKPPGRERIPLSSSQTAQIFGEVLL